jgi:hypothetical protein
MKTDGFVSPERFFNTSGSPATLSGKTRTALDFWKWAYSDLMQNITRGYVAQYIVAWSLGIDGRPNEPWLPFDLLAPNGKRIEVKSTAKVQAWESERTIPKFSLGPTLYWTSGGRSKEATWNADIYVLCYFHGTERNSEKIMDLDLWKFWVFKKESVLELLHGTKSIAVRALEKSGHKPGTAFQIRNAILDFDWPSA